MCLPIIGAVITGIGSAMSAMTATAQSKAQAEMDRRQAAIERQTGAYAADRKTDEVQRALGGSRAATIANGLSLSGGAFDYVDESAQEGALDVAAIRWNSSLAADNHMFRSAINEMNARSSAMAAPLAFLSPVIEGFAKYKGSYQGAS
jgi:hypothetical protein